MAELPRPKALVVYFSRSGTTRLLAEGIARAMHADVEELKEQRSRRGLLGWLRSGYEGTYALSSETLPIEHDLSAYDLIFIGSPTWNKGLSSPVRGFLKQHHSDLPRVALFATCQGNGAANVIEQMSQLLPEPPLATLAMLERHVKRHYAGQVGELVEAALCSLERVHSAR